MKSKIILALVACLLITTSAHAQSSKGKMIGLGMNPQLADYIARNLIAINTSGNMELRVPSGKRHTLLVAGTPVANIISGEISSVPSVFTPSLSLTPAAVLGSYNIVATAAPTLASGLLPTPVVDGQMNTTVNYGASPFVLFATGTPTINRGATRRVNIASGSKLVCKYSSNALSWICDLLAAGPTPAA